MKPDIAAIKANLDSYLAYECAIHGGTGTGLQMCYSYEKGHRNLLEWLADGGLAVLLAYIAELEADRRWVAVYERLPDIGREVDILTRKPEYNFILHQDRIRFTNMKTTTYYHELAFGSSEVMSPIPVRDISHWRYTDDDTPLSPLLCKPLPEGETMK